MKSQHSDKIHALAYSNDSSSEHLQHLVISASADRSVKLWDRRSAECVSSLSHQNSSFFSVATNTQVIAAGTNSAVVFWDIRKMKPPLFAYTSAHTDDVTCLQYHESNPQWMASCSTDNLMCHFNFQDKLSPENEEETMEGVYCSNQPLISCGFIGESKLWTLTSVNTVEIVNIENCDVFAKIEKVISDK